VLVAEAGATLAAVQARRGGGGGCFRCRWPPKARRGSAGVLATNAGGVGVLRYGNARDLCLGLEAVLADGTVCTG
jgi:FAD/FMN-containing dehydrogenase